MNIIFINALSEKGGAAIAARRIYSASEFGDKSFESIDSSVGKRLISKLIGRLSNLFVSRSRDGLVNTGLFGNFMSLRKASSYDIIHLHWINMGMVGIFGLFKLRNANIVWTMHDMWSFCPLEHYTMDESRYVFDNLKGFTRLEKMLIKMKRLAYQKIVFVAPSRWLEEAASKSEIMKGCTIVRIPNPIDTDVWKPLERAEARDRLGLAIPAEKQVLLFLAEGATSDPRKGFDRLLKVLNRLQNKEKIHLLVVGNTSKNDTGIDTTYLGYLDKIDDLIAAYNSCDFYLHTARLDNLPNSCLESISCGTPVLAFDVGGVSDMVQDSITGRLILDGDEGEFVRVIEKSLSMSVDRYRELRQSTRDFCVDRFSYEVIGKDYDALYRKFQ